MGKWLCMLLTGLLLLTGCSFTHGRFPFQKQAPPRFAVVNWDELVKRHPRYKEWERQKEQLEAADGSVTGSRKTAGSSWRSWAGCRK